MTIEQNMHTITGDEAPALHNRRSDVNYFTIKMYAPSVDIIIFTLKNEKLQILGDFSAVDKNFGRKKLASKAYRNKYPITKLSD